MITLRKLLPTQKLQYLVKEISAEVIENLKTYSLDVDVRFVGLEPEQVKLLHEEGFEVNVWTVNDRDDGLRLAQMGVDFITTNILE
jgi:glycerophosphoryl diester phosphodiesterase